jgi:uncharacterized membrane protein
MKNTNLHSFLSAICLAVMTWVGYETVQNGKSLATLTRAMTDAERKLEDTVPRRENDLRLSELEANVKQLASRVRELELATKLTKNP